jgi:hypothetical protein
MAVEIRLRRLFQRRGTNRHFFSGLPLSAVEGFDLVRNNAEQSRQNG